jgi:2,4-dienoyl-CoA reductase-like NADH-dependent reductase (Old Yellow Enzyme family)
MASKLFSAITMRGLTLSDRIVVAPMCQYASQDGNATDWHLMNLGQYAMGAGGLVMTEATHVSAEGRITPRCLGLYSDDNEATLKRVVDFCKQWGTSHMAIQIAHAGRKGSNRPPLNGGGALPVDEGAWETVGPSATSFGYWPAPRALDDSGLARIKQEFVDATIRADRVGFALAEMHGGHGYLLHQFVSPISNQRNDGYGGPLGNRMRFPLEVFEACRAVWPEDKPMGIRFSASDWVEGGFNLEESVIYARALKELGCDFVDVTSGGLDPRQKIDLRPGYQVHMAEKIRNEANIPVMAVGLIVEPEHAEDIIASGKADMVALARGMMDNPRWAWHAAQALGVEIKYPDQYARCAPNAWPGASQKKLALAAE